MPTPPSIPLAAPTPPAPPIPPATAHRDRQRPSPATTVRLVGSLVITVLAVLTLVLLGPENDAYSSDRLQIWLEDAANQDRTAGAPQQAVVNGWTGNALLDLVSEQLEDTSQSDERPAVLLTLGVMLGALHIATPPSRPRTSPAAADGRPTRDGNGLVTPPGRGELPQQSRSGGTPEAGLPGTGPGTAG